MISYSNLLRKLSENGLTRFSLTTEPGISSGTIAKTGRGEKIADRVLEKIAAFPGCSAEELWQSVSKVFCCKRSGTKKPCICHLVSFL